MTMGIGNNVRERKKKEREEEKKGECLKDVVICVWSIRLFSVCLELLTRLLAFKALQCSSVLIYMLLSFDD